MSTAPSAAHSSCVELETGGAEHVIFDLGSGARPLGQSLLGRYGPGVLLACVREGCRQAGFAPPCILRVELAVEELFTVTVCHGYGGDCDRPIWIETAQSADGLCVIYQDAADAFDPLAHPGTPQECRERPGGRGIALICSLAGRIAYVRSGDRNVLTLAFSASAA